MSKILQASQIVKAILIIIHVNFATIPLPIWSVAIRVPACLNLHSLVNYQIVLNVVAIQLVIFVKQVIKSRTELV